jgi:UDP-N-acetyl-D-glucosamine dehydrogenase
MQQDATDSTVAVVGLGYVGLPLAIAFADAGFTVIGVDVLEEKCDHINGGRSVTPDVSDAEVSAAVQAGRLRATTDFSSVAGAGLLSICVPTPLRKSKDPDISYIVDACMSIVPHVVKGTVVVLESTTYPGTTREIIQPNFEDAGFKVGEDLFLAFSPERIDPGNQHWTVKNTPKIVGGLTPTCTERACEFYAKALETVVPVPNAETAELCKLLENTFRSVNIGLVNEFAIVCNKLGVSTFDVIDAAATKPFGFMPFRPGPGLGGHCIPVDPLYLSWKMRTLDYKVRFIDLADEINSSMPTWMVHRVTDILNEDGKPIRGSRLLLLGLAYKRDVGDIRESPAVDLYEALEQRGAEVSFHDPHVARMDLRDEAVAGLSLADALAGQWDLILIATDHSSVDHGAFADLGVAVLDTRNALAGRQAPHIHGL